jgi:group II intron reverse transcriptase/maturase
VQFAVSVPTFEDKVAQRAVAMVLEVIYEQDFLPCSYGFRPGRSAHQALHTLRDAIWGQRLYWVLDVDIRKYFDSIPHSHLRSFLDQRVTDGVIRRMIDKWLKAGVVEDGLLHHTTAGSPQGGVISPCLSNVYLHYVLDEWFETEVRPRLKGRCTLVRYADDLVMAFEHCEDAKRVLAVLGKRLERYGLMLHPDKTRFVDFRPNRPDRTDHPATDGTSFDFLGFTHVWGKSRNGKNMVRQVTAKSRFARAMAAVTEWCRVNRHQPIPVQHARLAAMMRGHYAYYGIGGNGRRLRWYARQVVRTWKKWLSRRGRHGNVLWSRLTELLKHHPLPPPRIVRPYATASESLP